MLILGLRLPLHMDLYCLVISAESFDRVLDHAQFIEKMHQELKGGNNKIPQYQGNFCGSHSGSQLRGSSSQASYP